MFCRLPVISLALNLSSCFAISAEKSERTTQTPHERVSECATRHALHKSIGAAQIITGTGVGSMALAMGFFGGVQDWSYYKSARQEYRRSQQIYKKDPGQVARQFLKNSRLDAHMALAGLFCKSMVLAGIFGMSVYVAHNGVSKVAQSVSTTAPIDVTKNRP